MLSKKHSNPRLVAKRRDKGFSTPAGIRSINKKTTQPLPDASRIPWYQTTTQTGTNN